MQAKNIAHNIFHGLRQKSLKSYFIFQQAVEDVVLDIFSLHEPALMVKEFKNIFGIDVEDQEVAGISGKNYSPKAQKKFVTFFSKAAEVMHGEPELYKAGQQLVLQVIDNQWGEHLEIMDVLKEEANLFSYASQDPLIDFIRESRKLFDRMGLEVQRQFLKLLFAGLHQRGLVQ